MKYSEERLQSWTAPLSDTEKQRADNAIKMIRAAIDGSEELKHMDIEIFTQGSYANNTNVRSESDVDVCVMLKDVFHGVYPDGKKREDQQQPGDGKKSTQKTVASCGGSFCAVFYFVRSGKI